MLPVPEQLALGPMQQPRGLVLAQRLQAEQLALPRASERLGPLQAELALLAWG